MSGITDIHGEGWDTRKISKHIKERNNIANQQEEVTITTPKQFEKSHIIFSTMKKIKFTIKGKGKLFTIECYMPSFEPQNKSVCKQHASMFKNDEYTFNPLKDLMFSMLYQFVANLQPGKLPPVDNQRLKNLKRI